MTKVNKLLYLFVALILFIFPTKILAVHYVSPNGSDKNPGLQEKPWRTIQKAADEATDEVIVEEGEYNEHVNVNRPSVTFTAHGRVKLRGFSIDKHRVKMNGFEDDELKLGDANEDGNVDDIDFNDFWLVNYLKSLLGHIFGDFNSDNKVDGVDYVIWLKNYGK